MSVSISRRPRPRGTSLLPVRRVVVLLLILALACSNEGESPVGSSLAGDILGSAPGATRLDTIAIHADTVVRVNTLISTDTRLELGRQDNYDRVMIVRPSFSVPADTNRTVSLARFRFAMSENFPDIRARFLFLGTPYTEGTGYSFLDTTGVIVDPDNGDAETRLMRLAETRYRVPNALVDAWIRGDTANNGIAVVFTGTGDALAEFDSRENTGTDGNPVRLEVTFTDNVLRNYAVGNDATWMSPVTIAANHVVSDGYVQRLWWRVDLADIGDSVAVHNARALFHVVPESVLGARTLELYVPDSDNPTSTAFRNGTLITSAAVDTLANTVSFPVTLTMLSMLQGDILDNGFVIRYPSENTALRQVEMYGSTASPALRPRMSLVTSEPAEFER